MAEYEITIACCDEKAEGAYAYNAVPFADTPGRFRPRPNIVALHTRTERHGKK